MGDLAYQMGEISSFKEFIPYVGSNDRVVSRSTPWPWHTCRKPTYGVS